MQYIYNLRTIVKMLVSFTLIVLVSLVVNAFTWNSLSYLQSANGWTVHTYEVMDGVDGMVAAMVDRETGLRGYLLAGKEEFLEPYNAGSAAFAVAFDEVRKLTSDNATQQKRLDDLAGLVKGWTDNVAAKEIALMKDPSTVEQARAMEIEGAGKKYMDGIRAKAAEIAADEERLLGARSQASADAAAGARMTILSGAGAMIVLVAVALLLLQKSIVLPLVNMVAAMKHLAAGDTALTVPGVGRKDEVGEMATAVEVFRQNAIANKRLEEEAEEARGQTAATRAANEKRIQQEAEQLRFATQTLGDGLQRLASGDISFQLNEPFAADYEPLRQNFNASLSSLPRPSARF